VFLAAGPREFSGHPGGASPFHRQRVTAASNCASMNRGLITILTIIFTETRQPPQDHLLTAADGDRAPGA